MTAKDLRTCTSTTWRTPEYILDCVRRYFGGPIPLDPATAPDNPTKAIRFFTEADNGLVQHWGAAAFVNPPFGGSIREWTQRAAFQVALGCELIALLPYGTRFSTAYWQSDILAPGLGAMCFVNHRVAFIPDGDVVNTSGNNTDTCIYGFNVERDAFQRSFRKLGACLRVDGVVRPFARLSKPERYSKARP